MLPQQYLIFGKNTHPFCVSFVSLSNYKLGSRSKQPRTLFQPLSWQICTVKKFRICLPTSDYKCCRKHLVCKLHLEPPLRNVWLFDELPSVRPSSLWLCSWRTGLSIRIDCSYFHLVWSTMCGWSTPNICWSSSLLSSWWAASSPGG